MHTIDIPVTTDKRELYAQLRAQLTSLLAGERDLVANAANTAALLYHALPEVNWAGFYFLRGAELVLGPFQGQPACVRIALGKGVCGTAAQTGQSQLVPDVHQFPGHIACDTASVSYTHLDVYKRQGVPHGTMLALLELLKRVQALANCRGNAKRISKRKRWK